MYQVDKDDDATDAYSKDDIWKPPKKKKRRKSLEKKKSESRKHSQKTKSKKLKSNLKTKCVGLLQESQKEEDKPLEENNEPKASENVKPKTVELLVARSGCKYLVKWENLSYADTTWEHWTTIPKHILNVKISKNILFLISSLFQYYQRDLSRLGSSPYFSDESDLPDDNSQDKQ